SADVEGAGGGATLTAIVVGDVGVASATGGAVRCASACTDEGARVYLRSIIAVASSPPPTRKDAATAPCAHARRRERRSRHGGAAGRATTWRPGSACSGTGRRTGAGATASAASSSDGVDSKSLTS